jgi:predicted ArsR family transcriptional regulator
LESAVANVTPRQRDVLNAIRDYMVNHEFSPTLKEIGEAIGVSSPATVTKHVSALIRDGHLRRRRNQGRSIVLVDPAEKSMGRLYHLFGFDQYYPCGGIHDWIAASTSYDDLVTLSKNKLRDDFQIEYFDGAKWVPGP